MPTCYHINNAYAPKIKTEPSLSNERNLTFPWPLPSVGVSDLSGVEIRWRAPLCAVGARSKVARWRTPGAPQLGGVARRSILYSRFAHFGEESNFKVELKLEIPPRRQKLLIR
jgi:hypothetical protein